MTNKQKTDKKSDSKNNDTAPEQEDRYTAKERAADYRKYAQLKKKK